MRFRKLGNTELMVSEIGLGCSGYWGDKAFPERKAIGIIEKAYELGINFFDTGHNYSNFHAEPRLGRALKKVLNNSPRNKIIISTKAGSKAGYAPTVADNDTRFSDFTAEAIEKSCIESINNLQCEYLDVFQLHGFDKKTFSEELARCLQELKKKGLHFYPKKIIGGGRLEKQGRAGRILKCFTGQIRLKLQKNLIPQTKDGLK